MKIYTINLNNFDTFIIFKKNSYFLIFTSNLHYDLIIPYDSQNYGFYIDKYSKTINVLQKNTDVLTKITTNSNIKLKNIFLTYFFKIKFIGKGFRLQSFRNKKLMNFTFGHSHKMYMKLPLFFFKRISKYKYFFKCNRLNSINFLKNLFKKVKPINAYTLRGLRITRSLITKRKGRKSPTL